MASATTRCRPYGLWPVLPWGPSRTPIQHLSSAQHWVALLCLSYLRWYNANPPYPAPGQPSFVTYMNLDQDNAEALTGTITGLYYAGGIFGCLLNSWLADRVGRKWTAIIAYIILLISSACLCGSVHVAMFIVFRFFAGLRYTYLYSRRETRDG